MLICIICIIAMISVLEIMLMISLCEASNRADIRAGYKSVSMNIEKTEGIKDRGSDDHHRYD